MEAIKTQLAKKMNPLYGRGIGGLSQKNKVYSKQIENSDYLASPVSKYNGSVEEEVENGEGWVPGLRQLFDSALHTKDKLAVKALLKEVPPDYAFKFRGEINKVLQGS